MITPHANTDGNEPSIWGSQHPGSRRRIGNLVCGWRWVGIAGRTNWWCRTTIAHTDPAPYRRVMSVNPMRECLGLLRKTNSAPGLADTYEDIVEAGKQAWHFLNRGYKERISSSARAAGVCQGLGRPWLLCHR